MRLQPVGYGHSDEDAISECVGVKAVSHPGSVPRRQTLTASPAGGGMQSLPQLYPFSPDGLTAQSLSYRGGTHIHLFIIIYLLFVYLSSGTRIYLFIIIYNYLLFAYSSSGTCIYF
ncbi:hypothetical protein T492DRAFT_1014617 [Pavlovales sp. CCMP2436]|nr:hypothetical protein T492DRAFT_1014617 [Pavlovales sp. CCMP2436]